MRNLGLVGGLGPGATIQYYAELAGRGAGEILVVHADMDRVRLHVEREDRQGLAEYLARLIERMARGGAEVAAISAVTPHICIAELKKISPLPLVNILDAIGETIAARGYRKVALFGTRYVVQSRMFGMLDGVEVVVPEQVDAIHAAYMQIVNGEGEVARMTLSRIAHELPVDAVVLAGTDLAVVFDEGNTDFPHVDCLRAHVDAIVREL